MNGKVDFPVPGTPIRIYSLLYDYIFEIISHLFKVLRNECTLTVPKLRDFFTFRQIGLKRPLHYDQYWSPENALNFI